MGEVKIVLVGEFDGSDAEELVSRFYDAPKPSDADIDVLNVPKNRVKHSWAFDIMEPDTNIMEPDTKILEPDTNILEPETKILEPETIIHLKQEPMDTSGESSCLAEEAARRHGLTMGKVELLVMTSMIKNRIKGAMELREDGEHPRFHSLLYKGDLIPFVSCKECKKVLSWQPVDNLNAHIKEAHRESNTINAENLEKLIRYKVFPS